MTRSSTRRTAEYACSGALYGEQEVLQYRKPTAYRYKMDGLCVQVCQKENLCPEAPFMYQWRRFLE